jgi:hypothetical protein
MAFTLPTYVADPTLATGNLRLGTFVADPTLATGNLRLGAFVADPTLVLDSAGLPVFVSDPTLATGNLRLAAFEADGLPLSAEGISVQTELFTIAMDGLVGADGTIVQTMQPFTLSMTGVQQEPLVMENFIVSMTGEAGYVASLNVQMAHFTVEMTSDPFGAIDLQMQGFSSVLTGVAGSIGSMAGTAEYFTSVMTGYVQVTGSINVTPQGFSVSMSGSVSTGSSYSTVAMHSEWQAVTQYTNYPFNSFARFNNINLGAHSTGLYALTGDTDNGTAIAAAARVGITDMGTSHLKKVEDVYVGYRANGNLMLRVNTNDSHVRDYMIRHNGETGLHVKKVKLGKGVVARYWQLEVQNIDGADFDLNTLEIKPTVLKRRVSGGRA